MAKITVIIPIHNRLAVTQKGLNFLKKALDRNALYGDKSHSFDITVVDDGSTDGSPEYIQEHFPDVQLLRGDGTFWWTGSVDLGARNAVLERGATHILLWNDDLECDEDYFINLTTFLNENPRNESLLLVSKVLWSDTKTTLFNFGCLFEEKTGKKKMIGANDTDGEKYSTPTRVDWSGGMGTLIPSEVLTTIGFFDPVNFPQYHGDSDMFLRAKKAGFSTYAIPSLRVYNNRDTTGVKKIKKLKDVVPFFTSNRSNYNLVQNIKFTQRHCQSPFAWLHLIKTYTKVMLMSFR